jgi:hypothetical protein
LYRTRAVLIPRPILDGIAAGRVTLAFRRWRRPTVRAGGRLRTRIGELAITAVDIVDPGDITEADAARAGAASRAELVAFLDSRDGDVYRVALHLAGPDPRIALRERAAITADERAAIVRRLDRLDAASRRGPWTRTVLALIDANPAVRAPDLAARLGLETAPFKTDVRKLKELGLTESLEIGYRISPRGRAFLDGE